MIKKISGSLFFVFAALLSVLSFLNNNIAGSVIPVVIYVSAGILLFSFDGASAKNCAEGFRERKIQCVEIIVFLAVFTVFMIITGFVTGAKSSGKDISAVILESAINALPYFFAMIVFAVMTAVYVIPFWNCKKAFGLNSAKLNDFISSDEELKDYSGNNTVLAGRKAVLLTKTLCVLPFEYIDSVIFRSSVDKDIVFTLTDGKKLEIVANKKMYDAVESALDEYRKNS